MQYLFASSQLWSDKWKWMCVSVCERYNSETKENKKVKIDIHT
jgi:hypothetical protein